LADEQPEDSFQFIQTDEDSGLFMKAPPVDSFIQYNQFKAEKLKEKFKTVLKPESINDEEHGLS
jgi:hypothetical protein